MILFMLIIFLILLYIQKKTPLSPMQHQDISDINTSTERDKFINKLFEDLGINLLRYPSYNVYYKDTLKKRIQENIKDHYYID